ncbi:MAG: DUF2459 domain-containing protein [Alphaproteobacteria bacterium]|nr:DUF2459 domain-containing protein [Alphaproteobacteria bacterium]
MRHRIFAVWMLACTGWVAACATAPAPLPDDGAPRTETVDVVSNGWHTAIVIPREQLAATALLPEAADFPDAAFLQFGWGDRVYYPAKEKTLGMALGAALIPSPSVMHMAGLAVRPRPIDPGSEVVAVALSKRGLRRLIAAVAAQFKRPEGGRAAPVAPGLYPYSRFYDAHGKFHLFNTCNTWTARVLRMAGLDVTPAGVITAGELMARLRAALKERRSQGQRRAD